MEYMITIGEAWMYQVTLETKAYSMIYNCPFPNTNRIQSNKDSEKTYERNTQTIFI